MRDDKNRAIVLRKSGKSYNEIRDALGIAKSTLTSWFKNQKWSQKVKSRLAEVARENARKRMTAISHAAREKRAMVYEEHRRMARDNFRRLRGDELFMAGLMIYWGEGDNSIKNGIIRVTNTDPSMLKLFRIFLRKYLPDVYIKLKAYLILYPDLNDEVCKKFWARSLGISIDRFVKSQYITGSHPTKRLSYGVCTIVATSRAQKEIILEWLNLIRKEITLTRV